ncbi:DEAD/DEAH box helicase [Cereibacter sphaeroides]|uniref:SNF2-related protein n=1 Tax=Cereibacter sphaeroides TaxID=1063 RepID=UPI001F1B8589|nr:DEAD/DEAH box helicase [Cereibacter sphaeroides]MCE6958830.1 DEAD/DEAH box helicase [Cereibacter sphaeroides]MCE6973296.1 DEAD/DEAH box helicase [Cereibacter sphaeroides]
MTGRIDFRDGRWQIEDLPGHVSLRFKQVFSGIPFGSRPPYELKDTPDRAYDLQWFLQRYPITLTDRARQRMEMSVAAYETAQRTRTAILSGTYVPGEARGIKAPERADPHQVRAADLFRTSGRLLLLDDVGLGKTVSALAAIADGHGLPAAIVVQPHVADQWMGFIERFTHLRAVQIKSRTPHALEPRDIYVFRYTNLAAWVDHLPELGLSTAIFDEIQELRHGPSTDKGLGAQALVDLCENRLGLTATPIYNYGDEIFNVVEYVAPGCLGTREEFRVNWCRMHGSHWVVKDPEALGAYLQGEGIALRRTEDDLEVSQVLPPLRRMVFEVEWNEGDVETDRELQRRLAQRILTGSFSERGQAARELDLLLRQETGIAKARAVAAYVRTLVEGGEPVILGGWHRAVYDIWREALADLRVVMFTGTESQKQKAEARHAIMAGQADVIIISLRSGAGLDGLQDRVAHVVFGEFDWSGEVHKQLVGRARRRGQTREVTAHYLWTDGGSDPVLMSLLGLKAAQAHGILNPFAGGVQAAPEIDETRMRALALRVLEAGHAADGEAAVPAAPPLDEDEAEILWL